MNEILDLTEIAELIRNNEKIFEVNGITYRIKKPKYMAKSIWLPRGVKDELFKNNNDEGGEKFIKGIKKITMEIKERKIAENKRAKLFIFFSNGVEFDLKK